MCNSINSVIIVSQKTITCDHREHGSTSTMSTIILFFQTTLIIKASFTFELDFNCVLIKDQTLVWSGSLEPDEAKFSFI